MYTCAECTVEISNELVKPVPRYEGVKNMCITVPTSSKCSEKKNSIL